jgi:hypothetical protein
MNYRRFFKKIFGKPKKNYYGKVIHTNLKDFMEAFDRVIQSKK